MAAIILTEPGERIFEPAFGTSLSLVNLNAPLEIVKAEVRMKVATSLKRWEKRVQVNDVRVNLFEDEEYNVLVARIEIIFIDPMDIKNTQSLLLHKSLGGLDGRPMPF
jgi:phage baseplate assembly protein W